MKSLSGALAAAALTAAAAMGFIVAELGITAQAAQARAGCGDFYRVKRGDTLRSITVQTLGHDRYVVLFRANRDILPSPEKIVAGQLIYVPCPGARVKSRSVALAKAGRRATRRDNQGDRWALQSNGPPEAEAAQSVTVITPNRPKTAQSRTLPNVQSPPKVETAALAAQTKPSAAARPSDPSAEMLLLTASGLGPLVGEDLPEGGLVTMILAEALKATGGPVAAKPAFVDDRRAHLEVLMPTGAFALAYPWPAPDCGAARPGRRTATLCQDFIFSRPLYEMEIVTLAPRGTPLADAPGPAALAGKRVCRPEGFPAVDLEAARWPVTIIDARGVSGCIDMIGQGAADLISVPAPWAAAIEAQSFVRAENLGQTIPIHAAAWKAAPGARATIGRLNDGLENLQQSGRWFTMVSQYLTAYHRVTAAQN